MYLVILYQAIICDDRDPQWFNKNFKSLIYEKKSRCDRNNNLIKRQLNILQDRIVASVEASK